MKQYRYIGDDEFLIGMTALGQYNAPACDPSKFAVQVDDLNHPWAFGWHETPAEGWELESEEEWTDADSADNP